MSLCQCKDDVQCKRILSYYHIHEVSHYHEGVKVYLFYSFTLVHWNVGAFTKWKASKYFSLLYLCDI